MEQNSISEESQEQNTAPEAASSEAAPAADQNPVAETTAPVRRRASRRVTATSTDEAPAAAVEAPAAEAPAAAATTDAEATEPAAPKKRVSRARKKAESVEDDAAVVAPDAAEAVAAEPAKATEPAAEAAEDAAPKKAPATRRRRQTSAASENADAAQSEQAAAGADDEAKAVETKTGAAKASAAKADTAEASAAESAEEAAESAPRKRNTRTRSRKTNTDNADQSADQNDQKTADAEAAEKPAESEEAGDKAESNGNSNNGNNGRNNNGNNDGQNRSSRTRQRDRKRRGGSDDEPEITEDDVLLPIAGILDVLDNYAFVRTSGYLPGTGDVYVSLGQVKKYGLRKGDAVVGAIRQPRENEGGRQKYNAIVKVDSINSKPVEESQTRPEFADFTPIHPNERIRLETDATELGSRVIDLFAPIGKGQRGLIVGPHESGKSTALRQVAQAVAQNQPDAHLMLVVIDERPEEVTELQRTVNGEVIASTFDRPAEDHATIVELAVERAKRLVELGHDVVVLIDSLTSLARAYNLAAPAAVRVPAGSLDAAAVYPVKRLLSAARNIENGGSLTLIATISAQPESKLDEALLSELEGVANMQLRLSGDAADRRIFPAVDLAHSSTRNEARLTSDAEARVMNRIRRAQQGVHPAAELEQLLSQLESTSSNVEFLAVTQRQLDA